MTWLRITSIYMDNHYSDGLRDQVLGNQALLMDLFLVQPWVTKEDVVQLGLASSSADAENLLESLRTSGLIEIQEHGYTCSLETLEWVSALLPPQDDADTLRRAMRKHFQPGVQERVVYITRKAFSCVATNDHLVYRPPWYFDLNAIVHPALTINHDLNITGCSNALCNLVWSVYPDLRNQVDAGVLDLATFLRRLELYHFDYETLKPSDVHVMDPTPKFSGLLQHLAEKQAVDKKPALLRMGTIKHYVELSFALQVAFPGAQSIWHIVDPRVGQMRLIRAMRFTKWFITAHRLKQPANLFNITRATLQLLLQKCQQADITRQEIITEISEAIGSLSAGIEEFSRFVGEMSKDEYKIATLNLEEPGVEEQEGVPVLPLLEDVVTDIRFIYALPSGVEITVEGCDSSDTDFSVKANPLLLREALFNIIHNAFKHGAHNATSDMTKTIHIRCNCSVLKLVIEIEDNGPGMTAYALQEYAKAFEEIGTEISPAEVGALSGLSLAISVIKSSGGKISFENLKPTGFRTTLTFGG